MLGQSIGPVFGGLLTEFLGFHSIFWALAILGGLSVLTLVVFLPETHRSIAGDGSVELSGVRKPLIYLIRWQPHITSQSGRMVTSTTASLFQNRYDLNTLELGLAFLPNGKVTRRWRFPGAVLTQSHHRCWMCAGLLYHGFDDGRGLPTNDC